MKDNRLDFIDEVIDLNIREIDAINRKASQSREPMVLKDKLRMITLKNANNSLRRLKIKIQKND